MNNIIAWIKKDWLLKILTVMMLFSLSFSIYTLYKSLTLQPGQSVTISGGTKIERPITQIVDARLNGSGNLVVTYSTGESREVGTVTGKDGADGRPPTTQEIALAVKAYCLTNKCSESPTSAQVLQAVSAFCENGQCTGKTGKDGKSATDEQVAEAVAKYCASGKCQGAAGVAGSNGTNGVDGKDGKDGASPQLSCVNVKDNSGNQTSWVAWKYDGEANTAYRRLYKIDGDSNCINI